MTKRRFLVAMGVLTAFCVAALAVIRIDVLAEEVPSTEAHREASPLIVNTLEAVEMASYERERVYTGMLKESRRSQLSFLQGGEITEILVDEGDAVTKGQILSRIDSRHIQAGRLQLEAQLSEANAVLAELVAGPRQEAIAAKQAELRAQKARSESLKKQVARRGTLVDTNAVSREEFETVSFDLQATIAEVERLQSELDELLAGTRDEQITAQQARISQLQATLLDVDHDLEDAVLKAPFAGRITHRYVDEGTVVSSGSSVLEILDDTDLEAWIGLPASASNQLRVGESCHLSIDGKEVTAVIQSMSSEVNQATRTRMVRLRVGAGRELQLLPGQVVRMAVSETVLDSGFWVPTASLTKGTKGLWSVYVVHSKSDNPVAARSDVELLDTVGDRSFVRGAFKNGDQIITDGTHRIVAGQRVIPQAKLVVRSEN